MFLVHVEHFQQLEYRCIESHNIVSMYIFAIRDTNNNQCSISQTFCRNYQYLYKPSNVTITLMIRLDNKFKLTYIFSLKNVRYSTDLGLLD